MNPLLNLFLVSFLALVFMIVHKMYEQKSGRSFLFADLRERGDAFLGRLGKRTEARIAFLNKDNFRTAGRLVSLLVSRFFGVISREASLFKNEFLDAMKRRSVRKNQGTPSFYLRNVSEYKDGRVR